jgi:CO dehydrogenase nickel-insertion accessory protein CooC1
MFKSQAIKRLEEKIRKLESDIGAIKVVANEISNQDENILKQLEAELQIMKDKKLNDL